MKKKIISFVIPAKNEVDSVEILYNEIVKEAKKLKLAYEIIFIDDGSTDDTFIKLSTLKKRDKKIKCIRLRGNFGKSVALQAGFEHAKGDYIFTLDADLQDNPKEIASFLKELDNGYDLVIGWKKKRLDPSLSKVIPSRIFNYSVRLLTGVKVHDTNCGFKALRREVAETLTLYGELYRFIPILAAKQNYKLKEIIVEHRARKFGSTKYGIGRTIKGFLDLITIVFLTGYLRRPGHFFGSLGLISFFLGFIIGIYITYLRFTTGTIQYRQPLLFLGILLMIIGIQLISSGLLAEMIVSYNQKNTSTKNFIKEVI